MYNCEKNSELLINSQLQEIKSELWDINSQMQVIKLNSKGKYSNNNHKLISLDSETKNNIITQESPFDLLNTCDMPAPSSTISINSRTIWTRSNIHSHLDSCQAQLRSPWLISASPLLSIASGPGRWLQLPESHTHLSLTYRDTLVDISLPEWSKSFTIVQICSWRWYFHALLVYDVAYFYASWLRKYLRCQAGFMNNFHIIA